MYFIDGSLWLRGMGLKSECNHLISTITWWKQESYFASETQVTKVQLLLSSETQFLLKHAMKRKQPEITSCKEIWNSVTEQLEFIDDLLKVLKIPYPLFFFFVTHPQCDSRSYPVSRIRKRSNCSLMDTWHWKKKTDKTSWPPLIYHFIVCFTNFLFILLLQH